MQGSGTVTVAWQAQGHTQAQGQEKLEQEPMSHLSSDIQGQVECEACASSGRGCGAGLGLVSLPGPGLSPPWWQHGHTASLARLALADVTAGETSLFSRNALN